MPSVPMIPGGDSAIGQSPAMNQSSTPSEAQQLMALAEMSRMGRLDAPQRSMPEGPSRDPTKPHSPKRRLHVVR